MRLIKRILLSLATVVIMAITLAAILLLHLYKTGRRLKAFWRRTRTPFNIPPPRPLKGPENSFSGEEECDALESVPAHGKI